MDEKIIDITQIDAVFERFASSYSYIRVEWEKHLQNYYKDNPERLLYFDMMAVSAIIIELFIQKKSTALHAFFNEVEHVLVVANAEVKNLICAGLIEGIQQICQYENIDMRCEFDTWLQPLAKKEWDASTGLFNHTQWE